MIGYCGCTGTSLGVVYQDTVYGKGFRVLNLLPRAVVQAQRARCTCCGQVKEVKEPK